MYVEQYLVRGRQQEVIKQAQQAHLAQKLAEVSRVKRRQARAERQLLRAWQRLEDLLEAMSVS